MAKLLFVLFLSAHALAATPGAACETDRVENFSEAFRSSVNPDLNDYGLLVIDGGKAECVDRARERLLQKLRNTLAVTHHLDEKREIVGPYQGWLEGVHVTLIFTAAMEIHGLGAMTSELDAELQRVRDSYRFRRDADCGYSGDRWKRYNTCMDDFSVAASSFAWIAAYEYRRGRDKQPYAGLAAEMIARSLDSNESVCLHAPYSSLSSPSACNATHQDLMTRKAVLISLNHGQQSIPYGFGLMTGVAAAELGLLYAEEGYSLTLRERLIALALYDEARFKTTESGDHFRKDCATNLRFENGAWLRDDVADCGESLGYRPRMYPLWDYYRLRVDAPAGSLPSQVPAGRFIFNEFDSSLFSSSPTSFHNAGRMVMYGDLAYRWWLSPPPLPEAGKPLDDHDPVGTFAVTGPRELSGWACDPDAPSMPLRIDLFSSREATSEAAIGFTVAELPVAPPEAVSACGGSAVAFSVTLPRDTPVSPIYVFATDATGRGIARLAQMGVRRRPAAPAN